MIEGVNTMKITSFMKLACSTVLLTCSLGVYAGGGGNSNDGELPAPDSCETNCGYEIGSDPTLSALQSSLGSSPVATVSVSSSVDGFGGGTIYYPTNISQEMGTISIAPGFTNTQSAVQWWGAVLASRGFVVITINTNGRFDYPDSRSRQLDSALNYLISQSESSSSPISGLVDKNRLATMGYSMGGGGSLKSASRNRLSAAVPLSPWYSGSNTFNAINVPTMIVACESDGTANVGTHASPFYNRIPSSTDKVYLEMNNGSHNCSTGQSSSYRPALSTYGISWLKRFLDKDIRYNQFLCGPNHESNGLISEYRDNACGSI